MEGRRDGGVGAESSQVAANSIVYPHVYRAVAADGDGAVEIQAAGCQECQGGEGEDRK